MPRKWYSTDISTTPIDITVGALESAVEGGVEYIGSTGVALSSVAATILNTSTLTADADASVATDVLGSYLVLALSDLSPGETYYVPMVITPASGQHWERVLVVECPGGS